MREGGGVGYRSRSAFRIETVDSNFLLCLEFFSPQVNDTPRSAFRDKTLFFFPLRPCDFFCRLLVLQPHAALCNPLYFFLYSDNNISLGACPFYFLWKEEGGGNEVRRRVMKRIGQDAEESEKGYGEGYLVPEKLHSKKGVGHYRAQREVVRSRVRSGYKSCSSPCEEWRNEYWQSRGPFPSLGRTTMYSSSPSNNIKRRKKKTLEKWKEWGTVANRVATLFPPSLMSTEFAKPHTYIRSG